MTNTPNTPESKDTPVTITIYSNRYKGMLREFTDKDIEPILFLVSKTNDNPSDVALPLGTIRDLFYEGASAVEGQRPVITVRINGREREVALAEAPSEMEPGFFDASIKLPPPAEPSGVMLRRMMEKIDEMRALIEELVSEVKLPEQSVPEPKHVLPMEPLGPEWTKDKDNG